MGVSLCARLAIQTIKEMQDAQYKYTTKTTEQIAKQQEIRGTLRELNQMYKDMELLLQKDRKKKVSYCSCAIKWRQSVVTCW